MNGFRFSRSSKRSGGVRHAPTHSSLSRGASARVSLAWAEVTSRLHLADQRRALSPSRVIDPLLRFRFEPPGPRRLPCTQHARHRQLAPTGTRVRQEGVSRAGSCPLAMADRESSSQGRAGLPITGSPLRSISLTRQVAARQARWRENSSAAGGRLVPSPGHREYPRCLSGRNGHAGEEIRLSQRTPRRKIKSSVPAEVTRLTVDGPVRFQRFRPFDKGAVGSIRFFRPEQP